MAGDIKMEGVPIPSIKVETSDGAPSPYSDDDEMYEDAGDLDFSDANRDLWLSHIPKALWDALSQVDEEEEIEIGTVRVEQTPVGPGRVSLRLHSNMKQFRSLPKDYILQSTDRSSSKKRPAGTAFIFSEKDLPGQKSRRTMALEDDGADIYHARSYLFEKNKRDKMRKETKRRSQNDWKRQNPRQTALTGWISQDFECVPVRNEAYLKFDAERTQEMLKIKPKPETLFTIEAPQTLATGMLSQADKAFLNKQNQARKQAAKDNRASRIEKNVLIDQLLKLFEQYRCWPIKSLKARVNQPEAWLREVLGDIAVMHKSGDFNGMWELKSSFQQGVAIPNESVAPEADESGVDDDEEEDDMKFEDV